MPRKYTPRNKRPPLGVEDILRLMETGEWWLVHRADPRYVRLEHQTDRTEQPRRVKVDTFWDMATQKLITPGGGWIDPETTTTIETVYMITERGRGLIKVPTD